MHAKTLSRDFYLSVAQDIVDKDTCLLEFDLFELQALQNTPDSVCAIMKEVIQKKLFKEVLSEQIGKISHARISHNSKGQFNDVDNRRKVFQLVVI